MHRYKDFPHSIRVATRCFCDRDMRHAAALGGGSCLNFNRAIAIGLSDQFNPVILTKSERPRSEDAWKDPENFSSAMLH
jgi:hypothetical protein